MEGHATVETLLAELKLSEMFVAKSEPSMIDLLFTDQVSNLSLTFGASVRRSSGRRSGGRLLAMT